MPAQKREARRNYIDLVSDEGGQQDAPGREPGLAHPLKEYLRLLVAGMLRTRGGAR